MNKWLLAVLVSIMVVSLPCAAFAQEEDTEYGYGTVVTVDVSKNEIVINEYDYENDKEITITYSIDPEVKFGNVESLKEITPDTYVDIEYTIREDGKKIAKVINTYKTESEEHELGYEE